MPFNHSGLDCLVVDIARGKLVDFGGRSGLHARGSLTDHGRGFTCPGTRNDSGRHAFGGNRGTDRGRNGENSGFPAFFWLTPRVAVQAACRYCRPRQGRRNPRWFPPDAGRTRCGRLGDRGKGG